MIKHTGCIASPKNCNRVVRFCRYTRLPSRGLKPLADIPMIWLVIPLIHPAPLTGAETLEFFEQKIINTNTTRSPHGG